jgi:hypothetical protein
LAEGRKDTTVGDEFRVEDQFVYEAVGLDTLLDIERRTVER